MITEKQLDTKLEALRKEINHRLDLVDVKFDAKFEALNAAINRTHTMQMVLVGSILGMTGLGVLGAIIKWLFFAGA